LGKFLDPIADKLLVISVMLVLIQTGRIHSLVVIIVIIREFVITGIRLIGAEKGQVIAAGWLGKAKTVSQIIALLLLLIEPVILSISESYFEPRILIAVNNSFLMIAVVMTLLSGMQYLYHHRSLLNQPEHDT
jgi:CDP-diacylglycerol--glycerol-3-phosphate 3-phosphatidyltransferase